MKSIDEAEAKGMTEERFAKLLPDRKA